MSKSRDQKNARALEDLEQRRRSGAHRSLRTRLERRDARAASSPTAAAPALAVPTFAAPVATPAPAVEPAHTVVPVEVAAEPEPDAAELDATEPDATELETAEVPAPRTSIFPPVAADGDTPAGPVQAVEAPDSSFAGQDQDTTVLAPVVEPVVDPTVVAMPPVAAAPVMAPREMPAPVPPAGPAPTTDGPVEPEGRGRRQWPWLVAAAAVLAVAYIGAQALVADTAPRDTTALGTDIGGMSSAEAVEAIDVIGAELASQPITVGVEGSVALVVPSELGLGIDSQATVAQVTGFTLSPVRLLDHISGGGEIDPVLTVDQDTLDAAVRAASAQIDGNAVDAVVQISDGVATAVPGATAAHVDQAAATSIIATQWIDSSVIELPAVQVEPEVDVATAAAFADELNSGLLSSTVTLTSAAGDSVLTPAEFSAGATVSTDSGAMMLELDGPAIAAAVAAQVPGTVVAPGEPTFSFDANHLLVIAEGAAGSGPDEAAIMQAVLTAAETPERTAELPIAEVAAAPAADEGATDFTEVVASFDTPLTSDAIRTSNLIAGADHIQGIILMPGDEFNLIEALGEISAEEGYVESWVLVNNLPARAMGGGLSQMATTVYNAAYFAGFDITQWQPHSVHFSRYPAGRESTVWSGGNQINVRFTNNTPYAAIMDSYVKNNRVYVSIWSTPHFRVETRASSWSGLVDATRVEVDITENPECIDTPAAEPGFTVTNWRDIYLGDELVDQESFTWRYSPHNGVKCVDPSAEEDAEPADG